MAQLKPGTTIGGRNIVQELDSHKNDKVAHIDYAVASGTNTYTANIQGITALVEGLSVKIKFQNANTGASTLNINGLGAKEIRKSNGNTLSSGNIKAGQICHLVYTGSVFQLLGEGGEYGTATPAEVLKGYTIGTEDGIKEGTLELTGNATTGDVLAGKTFYNTNAKSKQTGAMPNHGAKTITPSNVNIAIPQGYHNGQGYVVGSPNLVASNIKSGVDIFGVTGTLKEFKGKSYPEARLEFDTLYTVDNIGFVPKLIIINGYTDFIECLVVNSRDSYRIYGTVAAAKDFSVNYDLETYFVDYPSSEGGVRLSIVTWGSNSVTYKIIATAYGAYEDEFTYFRAKGIYVFG